MIKTQQNGETEPGVRSPRRSNGCVYCAMKNAAVAVGFTVYGDVAFATGVYGPLTEVAERRVPVKVIWMAPPERTTD